MASKYPLEPLQKQREQTTLRETVKLGDARQNTAAARALHRAAEMEHDAMQDQLAIGQRAERERLADNGARAADLVRDALFTARAEQSLAAMQGAADAAAEKLARAVQAEEQQRALLVQATHRAKAVDDHRGRWEEKAQQRLERRAEEAAQDNWASHASHVDET